MVRRRPTNRGFRIMMALALVVAVMTSPVRPPRSNPDGLEKDYLKRNVALPKSDTTHHRSHAPTHSRVIQVKAVHSKNEHRLTETSCQPVLMSRPSASPSTQFVPQSLSCVVDGSSHPLRC